MKSAFDLLCWTVVVIVSIFVVSVILWMNGGILLVLGGIAAVATLWLVPPARPLS